MSSKIIRQLKIKKLSLEKAPLDIFSKLYSQHENAYILESIEGPKKLSQYSFIGFSPVATITIKNGESTTLNKRTGEKQTKKVDEPLSAIAKTLKSLPGFLDQRFVGGAVGYIGYDAVRYWEKLPEKVVDDQKFPDVKVGIFDDGKRTTSIVLFSCIKLTLVVI